MVSGMFETAPCERWREVMTDLISLLSNGNTLGQHRAIGESTNARSDSGCIRNRFLRIRIVESCTALSDSYHTQVRHSVDV